MFPLLVPLSPSPNPSTARLLDGAFQLFPGAVQTLRKGHATRSYGDGATQTNWLNDVTTNQWRRG